MELNIILSVTPSPSNTEPDLPDRSQSSTDQHSSTGLQSSTNPPSSTDKQSSTNPPSSTDQQSSTPSSYTETNISSNTETPPTVKQSDVSSNNKSENPGNFSQVRLLYIYYDKIINLQFLFHFITCYSTNILVEHEHSYKSEDTCVANPHTFDFTFCQ